MSVQVYRAFPFYTDRKRDELDFPIFSIVVSDKNGKYVFAKEPNDSGLDDSRIKMLVGTLDAKPRSADEWLNLLSTNLGYIELVRVDQSRYEGFDDDAETFDDAVEFEKGILSIFLEYGGSRSPEQVGLNDE